MAGTGTGDPGMALRRGGGGPGLLLLLLGTACLTPPSAQVRRLVRCPATCSCTKESIICVGSSWVPRIVPGDISSL